MPGSLPLREEARASQQMPWAHGRVKSSPAWLGLRFKQTVLLEGSQCRQVPSLALQERDNCRVRQRVGGLWASLRGQDSSVQGAGEGDLAFLASSEFIPDGLINGRKH